MANAKSERYLQEKALSQQQSRDTITRLMDQAKTQEEEIAGLKAQVGKLRSEKESLELKIV